VKKLLRFLLAVMVLTPFFAFAPGESCRVYASRATAEQATLSAAFVPPAEGDLSAVLDHSEYTSFAAASQTRLRFSASAPVMSLYFLFDEPCEWTLVLSGGKALPGGRNGFIHEYFGLSEAVTGFDMIIPAGCRLTEAYAFTDGELPEWVHIWEPPCEKADLMIMPTHADDEHLWFGGAMPYYAGELGCKVQVVYLTYHADAPWRFHELLNGLWTVGVRNYPVFVDKFRDTVDTKPSLYAAQSIFGHDRVLEYQVEMLRRFSPRVILAHDINGEYGHGAHKLNASTLLEALRIYEDPAVFPESAGKYGISQVQKCYLHLWPENRITVSWSDKKLSRFGGRSALDMAIEGYHCHKSQLRWRYHVREWGKYDCRQFGLAYTTVGYDTPGLGDLFENATLWEQTPGADAAGKPEAAEEEPKDETVPSRTSASNTIVIEPLSFADPWLNLCGIKVRFSDLLVGLTAAMLLAWALASTVCLKLRELIHINR
jgi:Uncharacterized proteins, LmbE homologs